MLSIIDNLNQWFYEDTHYYVKNYLDVVQMHPTRRWKVLILYYTDAISFKWSLKWFTYPSYLSRIQWLSYVILLLFEQKCIIISIS